MQCKPSANQVSGIRNATDEDANSDQFCRSKCFLSERGLSERGFGGMSWINRMTHYKKKSPVVRGFSQNMFGFSVGQKSCIGYGFKRASIFFHRYWIEQMQCTPSANRVIQIRNASDEDANGDQFYSIKCFVLNVGSYKYGDHDPLRSQQRERHGLLVS